MYFRGAVALGSHVSGTWEMSLSWKTTSDTSCCSLIQQTSAVLCGWHTMLIHLYDCAPPPPSSRSVKLTNTCWFSSFSALTHHIEQIALRGSLQFFEELTIVIMMNYFWSYILYLCYNSMLIITQPKSFNDFLRQTLISSSPLTRDVRTLNNILKLLTVVCYSHWLPFFS